MSAHRTLTATPLPKVAMTPAYAMALAGAAVILARAAVSEPLPAAEAAWGGVALASWCAALLATVASSARRDGLGLAEWKIGSWSLLWCGVTSGIASITWADPQYGTPAQILPSSVVRAEWLTAVAMTGWAAGYLVGPRRLAVVKGARFLHRLTDRRSDMVRSPRTPWLLYAAGTVARIAAIVVTGRFGYVGDAASVVSSASAWQQALSLAALCAPIAIAVAALRAFRERVPGARVTLVVLVAAETVEAAASGGKQGFAVAVLAVIVPWASAGGRIPVRLTAVAAAFFLVIVIPFTLAYRADVRSNTGSLTPTEALSAAPGITRDVTASASPGTIPGSVAYLAARVQEIDAPAIVVQRTPGQIPFASPAQLPESLVASLVPRALWPGKPVIVTGYQFSREYYGTPSNVYSSATVTPWADLYRHGGWIPVLAGMFLLGCLVRVLDDVLDIRTDPRALLLVLLLFPTLVKSEDDWVSMLSGIPGIILLWLVVTAVAFRRHPSSYAPPDLVSLPPP
jgi:hypothetical protein